MTIHSITYLRFESCFHFGCGVSQICVLRVMDEGKFDGREGNTGGWKALPAHLSHLTQQISHLVRRHKIGNVIHVLGPWDVVLSKVHL